MLLRLPGTYPAQGDTHLLVDVVEGHGLVAGRRVLDVCTGGGAIAIAAAAAGAASVTAVDLSARSVLTARANALLNRQRVRVVQGDLFAPVSGQRFDVVLANPPYVPAADDVLPRHRIARSWDAGTDGRALLDRICAGVRDVLAPGGSVVLTQSEVADPDLTVSMLVDAGLQAAVVARSHVPFGPVMRRRAALLESQGLIAPGQTLEELVVIEARLDQAEEGEGSAAAAGASGAAGQDEDCCAA